MGVEIFIKYFSQVTSLFYDNSTQHERNEKPPEEFPLVEVVTFASNTSEQPQGPENSNTDSRELNKKENEFLMNVFLNEEIEEEIKELIKNHVNIIDKLVNHYSINQNFTDDALKVIFPPVLLDDEKGFFWILLINIFSLNVSPNKIKNLELNLIDIFENFKNSSVETVETVETDKKDEKDVTIDFYVSLYSELIKNNIPYFLFFTLEDALIEIKRKLSSIISSIFSPVNDVKNFLCFQDNIITIKNEYKDKIFEEILQKFEIELRVMFNNDEVSKNNFINNVIASVEDDLNESVKIKTVLKK